MAEEKGVWRTVSGRRIFIAEGQSLSEAMAKSGKFENHNQDEDWDYTKTPYYRDLVRQLSELNRKEKELNENEPEDKKFDLKTVPEGWTEEEWSEMSRTEKEAMLSLFDRIDNGENDHDRWMNQKMEIDKEQSRILGLMEKTKHDAFEKSGGNTFANKLPEEAKSKTYDGFKLDTNEYHQDYLEDPEYAKSKGYKEVYIAEMSPDEYLERCSREIFEEVPEVMVREIPGQSDIKKYADMMDEGVDFDMPYLDLKIKAQEGRHRALAAKRRGIKKIPVLYLR